MKACRKCGCTEQSACVEFDAEGYAHACCWWEADLCSACTFDTAGTRDAMVVQVGKRKRQFLRVPELAGMVARPR